MWKTLRKKPYKSAFVGKKVWIKGSAKLSHSGTLVCQKTVGANLIIPRTIQIYNHCAYNHFHSLLRTDLTDPSDSRPANVFGK